MRSLRPLLALGLAVSSVTAAVHVFSLADAHAQGRRGKKEPRREEPIASESRADAAVLDAGVAATVVLDAGVAYDGGAWTSPLTPRPEEFPQQGALVPADYDRLIADIAALRARVATASDAVFKSRLAVAVRAPAGNVRIKKLRILLDDGTVYTAPSGFHAEDATVVFDRGISPGRHLLTFDVEGEDARDRSYVTGQLTRMPIEIPRDHRVRVEARLDDDSGMADSYARSKKGSYDLRVRLKAEATAVR